MKKIMTLHVLASLCIFVLGCDEEVQDIICEGVVLGATEIVAALFSALFAVIGQAI